MSAFVCHDNHFAALAIFAVHRHRGDSGAAYWHSTIPALDDAAKAGYGRPWEMLDDDERAQVIANILKAENVRSVNHRYKETDMHEPVKMGGAVTVSAEYNGKRKEYRSTLGALRLSPVAILKLCACLEYQSCEAEDWENTSAHALIRKIEAQAIRRLVGYDDAPWALDEDLSVAFVAA